MIRLIPLLAGAVSLAAFLARSPFAVSDFPLDDAWIHRVYARAFAFLHGFAYNPGQQETGATSPLWVVVTAPAHWLEPWLGLGATVLAVKAIGVVLTLASIAAVADLTRRWTGSPVAGAFAGVLFAVEPRLAFSALSGMETPLVLALWVGAAWALVAGRPYLALVAAGLLPVTRPEAALLVPVLALVAAVEIRRSAERPAPWRRLLPWVGMVGVIAPGLVWLLVCLSISGHPLPNTFYVKAHGLALAGSSWAQAWSALTQYGWAAQPGFGVVVVGMACWAFWQGRRDGRTVAVVLVAAAWVYQLAVVATRDFRLDLDGYYWTRWVDPSSLALTAAFAIGMAVAAAALAAWHRRIAVGVSLAAVAWMSTTLVPSHIERAVRLGTDSRAIRRVNVAAGEWIRDHTAADDVIGVVDAGAIRYFGQRRTIDLLGLNYAPIAFRQAGAGAAVVQQLDWLAVFPYVIEGTPLAAAFVERQRFSVTTEEYTICRCPAQTVKVIAQRR